MLPLELGGRSTAEARHLAREALAEVGLTDRVDEFPVRLSGGEEQRVAIARGLIGDRRILLADEPTGALDSLAAESVMHLIRTRCDAGAAAIVATHDATLAAYADRVVFLRDGAIAGEVAEALT
jgi:putative ABC transport system ATP-binding protein